jgi:hypothetical protein
VSKAGASALFRDASAPLSTLGVTVSPVLVQSLADFGTLAEVTAKLVAAERDKESTLSVDVLVSSERTSAHGAPLYEIDYLLDSSRGRKRVLNAVCIDAGTLYIYALQFKARGREASGRAAATVAHVVARGLTRVPSPLPGRRWRGSLRPRWRTRCRSCSPPSSQGSE